MWQRAPNKPQYINCTLYKLISPSVKETKSTLRKSHEQESSMTQWLLEQLLQLMEVSPVLLPSCQIVAVYHRSSKSKHKHKKILKAARNSKITCTIKF